MSNSQDLPADDFALWQERGEAAVARLHQHGLTGASCHVVTKHEGGESVRRLIVNGDPRLAIVHFELAANYLDVLRGDMDRMAIEDLINPAGADDDDGA